MNENEIGTILIESALEIHRAFGPALLESAYEALLVHELKNRGLSCESQVSVSLEWKGVRIADAFRADLIIDKKVLVELKSVEKVSKVHHKQVYTYVKVSQLKLGYLINFGEHLLKNGIHRIIN